MTGCRGGCFRQLGWVVSALVVAGLWLTPVEASGQALTSHASHQQVGRSVVVTTDSGQKLRVTPYGDAAVRIQAVPAGASFLPDDHLDMVERHDQGGTFTIVDGAAALELTHAAGARVRLQKAPLRVQLYRDGATTPFLADAGGVVFGGGGVAQRFALTPGERFAGLGHGYLGRVGKLELTGTEVARNYGSAQGEQAPLIVPFYLSSHGYGVLAHSSVANRFRFGIGGSTEVFLAGSEMDYFVFLGPDLPAVLAQYTALTGRPRLPPLAMFGLALSDKAHPTVSAAAWWLAKVHEHRARGWPLDHLVNDNRWRAGGGERCTSRFAWDPLRYPDPAAFRAWMQRQGLVATLDFNRCIANQSAGWQPSFNLPEPGTVDFSTSAPDLSRADVRAWWWNLMWTQTLDPALALPGDALWIDEFDEMGSAPANQVLGNGRTWGEMRNVWFLLIARALGEDGWDASIGAARRPFTWVRGMSAGGQRYATLWSGDIDPTYAEMKLQIRGMLAAGLGGFPFWGHDAGGFHGEPVSATQFDAIYRQWSMAFGAFTPYWKPHGTLHSRWPIDRSPLAQRAASVYGELRYRLLPYTYSAAREAAATGLPIARAMLLVYADRPEAWARDQQYLWGNDLLVVPNAAAGDNDVGVWLPPGDWYDFWNDTRLDGDRALTVWAPQGRVLLYARAGAILPMAPAASSTAFLRRDVLELHVYAGADGSFSLREDDGATESYRDGGRTTVITYEQGSRTLTIGAAQGDYTGAPASRRYRVVVHGLATPASARVGGVAAEPRHDLHEAEVLGSGSAWLERNTHGVLAVVVPATPVDRALTLVVSDCAVSRPQRHEAEAGATDATRAAKPAASGGAYVGGLNAIGRHVDLTVAAAAAGDHEVSIGYANGRANRAVRGLYLDGVRVHDVVFPATPDWDAFSVSAPVRVALRAGTNTLRLQTDAGDDETVDLDFIDVAAAPAQRIAPFHQALDASALVVVEAEHFHQRVDAGGHGWHELTTAEGYAGDGAVIASPNRGSSRDGATGPRLEYDLHLARAGAHQLWVRGRAHGASGDDELTLGLAGSPGATVSLAAADDFTWVRGPIVQVAAPGVHTLVLWMREDGAIVDRLLLTPDQAYTPDGLGPEESGHQPPVPPDVDPPDLDPPDDDPPGDDPPGGCGCHTSSSAPGGGLLVLGVLAWVARRRRSR